MSTTTAPEATHNPVHVCEEGSDCHSRPLTPEEWAALAHVESPDFAGMELAAYMAKRGEMYRNIQDRFQKTWLRLLAEGGKVYWYEILLEVWDEYDSRGDLFKAFEKWLWTCIRNTKRSASRPTAEKRARKVPLEVKVNKGLIEFPLPDPAADNSYRRQLRADLNWAVSQLTPNGQCLVMAWVNGTDKASDRFSLRRAFQQMKKALETQGYSKGKN